jgi:hypothetical protein
MTHLTVLELDYIQVRWLVFSFTGLPFDLVSFKMTPINACVFHLRWKLVP